MKIQVEHGYQKLPGNAKDYFTVHLGFLRHPWQGLRCAALSSLETSTISPATYPALLDAYVGYGPADELQETLWRVWSEAEWESEERCYAGRAYLDLRVRRYVWENAGKAQELGFVPLALVDAPKFRTKGFRGGLGNVPERLIAKGDRDFIRVWEDYQHGQALNLEDKLKPIRWDDTGQGSTGDGKGKGRP